jgi:hypothetical protein
VVGVCAGTKETWGENSMYNNGPQNFLNNNKTCICVGYIHQAVTNILVIGKMNLRTI